MDPAPVASAGDCDCGLAFAVSKTTTCVLELMLNRNGFFQWPPVAVRSFAGLSQVCTPVVSYALVSRKRYQPWPARLHCSWLPRVMIHGAAARSGAPGG